MIIKIIQFCKNMEERKLYKFAELFLKTLIEIKDKLSDEFKFFPNGSCGTTCLLLGTFLSENGFGKFKMIRGEKYYWKGNYYIEDSHAWLESENSLIIDITAYQFPEISEQIIIEKKNSWYKQWKIIEEIEDANIYNTMASINTDFCNYALIKEWIQKKYF